MALYEMAGCPRETSFESDELQEYWVEEVRSNRRLFIRGARWKFKRFLSCSGIAGQGLDTQPVHVLVAPHGGVRILTRYHCV